MTGEEAGARVGAAPVAAILVAAIVVAGGRSSRFGSDKLQHVLDGNTLLQRTMDAVRDIPHVVVVTAADLPDADAVTVSEFPRWGGPCAAVAAGVDALTSSVGRPLTDGDLLLLPADLADPWSAAEALRAIGLGVLTDQDGRPQWLLARASLAALHARIDELRADGGLPGRPASALFDRDTRRHAAAAHACADIDTRADLPTARTTDDRRLVHGTV
ncbi:NTP transferase domain-containing protein [Leifsonia shinshuensis]|uniref:molybdenum cofactor guanylyltransferase n=1 Tax=Leifsonia shinshuensis TaxID=150026 RepID=UPI00285CEE8F|nr:NTP transferase domain-containing protein [Leifsonia shinshuensis]MDR6972131.1 molybdopterin-guanine dinucleotide biosynthesis protein A [Leifsonia shinshuensis]